MVKNTLLLLLITANAWASAKGPDAHFQCNANLSDLGLNQPVTGNGAPGGVVQQINDAFQASKNTPSFPKIDCSDILTRTQQYADAAVTYAKDTERYKKAFEEFKAQRQSNPLTQHNQSISVTNTATGKQALIDKASGQWIAKKSTDVLQKMDQSLPDYPINDLKAEISSWTQYSGERKQVLELTERFAAEADRLNTSIILDQSFRDISQAAIESGLGSLTEAAEITSNPQAQAFAASFEVSNRAYEIGKAVLDVGLGLTPGISIGKDAYEALTGKSLIDGTQLDTFSRSFAVLGVVTAGGSNIAKTAVKALVNISRVAGRAGNLGHGFSSAIHVAEAGATNISRHTSVSQGILHTTPLPGMNLAQSIPREVRPMQTVSDTFRSATYVTYTTTEPLILYRVASVTPETTAKMLDLGTTQAHWSRYWTRFKPTSPTQAMIDSALERSWGSNANVWAKIEVPTGTVLHEGVTASIQRIGNNMSEFVGGGNQIYYKGDIPKEWLKEVGRFFE